MKPVEDWVALFDWDGVIVDSREFHRRSWDLLAGRRGLSLPEGHFERGFGKRNQEIIPELGWSEDAGEVAALSDEKEAAYRDLIRADGIAPLPGVRAWLDTLQGAGVRCAVASSTPRENITCVLGMWGWDGDFERILAAEDVRRGKPDPEVFLKAAAALDATPDRAVVFEDSPMGLEAARAGGMRRIAVAGTHAAETFADVDQIVHRLDECNLAVIGAWWARSG